MKASKILSVILLILVITYSFSTIIVLAIQTHYRIDELEENVANTKRLLGSKNHYVFYTHDNYYVLGMTETGTPTSHPEWKIYNSTDKINWTESYRHLDEGYGYEQNYFAACMDKFGDIHIVYTDEDAPQPLKYVKMDVFDGIGNYNLSTPTVIINSIGCVDIKCDDEGCPVVLAGGWSQSNLWLIGSSSNSSWTQDYSITFSRGEDDYYYNGGALCPMKGNNGKDWLIVYRYWNMTGSYYKWVCRYFDEVSELVGAQYDIDDTFREYGLDFQAGDCELYHPNGLDVIYEPEENTTFVGGIAHDHTDSGDREMRIYKTEDGGKTWSDPHVVYDPMPAVTDWAGLILRLDEDDNLWCFWRHNDDEGNATFLYDYLLQHRIANFNDPWDVEEREFYTWTPTYEDIYEGGEAWSISRSGNREDLQMIFVNGTYNQPYPDNCILKEKFAKMDELGWTIDGVGFKHRKKVTIWGGGEDVTDYDMKVVILKEKGVDVGDWIYTNEHCRDDFLDICFTDESHNRLDSWMRFYEDGKFAEFWVEFPSITANPSTLDFYIYYKNITAIPDWNSNMSIVFPVWDDFDSGYNINDKLKSSRGWYNYSSSSGDLFIVDADPDDSSNQVLRMYEDDGTPQNTSYVRNTFTDMVRCRLGYEVRVDAESNRWLYSGFYEDKIERTQVLTSFTLSRYKHLYNDGSTKEFPEELGFVDIEWEPNTHTVDMDTDQFWFETLYWHEEEGAFHNATLTVTANNFRIRTDWQYARNDYIDDFFVTEWITDPPRIGLGEPTTIVENLASPDRLGYAMQNRVWYVPDPVDKWYVFYCTDTFYIGYKFSDSYECNSWSNEITTNMYIQAEGTNFDVYLVPNKQGETRKFLITYGTCVDNQNLYVSEWEVLPQEPYNGILNNTKSTACMSPNPSYAWTRPSVVCNGTGDYPNQTIFVAFRIDDTSTEAYCLNGSWTAGWDGTYGTISVANNIFPRLVPKGGTGNIYWMWVEGGSSTTVKEWDGVLGTWLSDTVPFYQSSNAGWQYMGDYWYGKDSKQWKTWQLDGIGVYGVTIQYEFQTQQFKLDNEGTTFREAFPTMYQHDDTIGVWHIDDQYRVSYDFTSFTGVHGATGLTLPDQFIPWGQRQAGAESFKLGNLTSGVNRQTINCPPYPAEMDNPERTKDYVLVIFQVTTSSADIRGLLFGNYEEEYELIIPYRPQLLNLTIRHNVDGINLTNPDYWMYQGEVYEFDSWWNNTNVAYLNWTDYLHDFFFRYQNGTGDYSSDDVWIEVEGYQGLYEKELVIGEIRTRSVKVGLLTRVRWKFVLGINILDVFPENCTVDFWCQNRFGNTTSGSSNLTFHIYNLGGYVEYVFQGDGHRVSGGRNFELEVTNGTLGSTAYAYEVFRRLEHTHILFSLHTNMTWNWVWDKWNAPIGDGGLEIGIDYRINGSWVKGWSCEILCNNANIGHHELGADRAWIKYAVRWWNRGYLKRTDILFSYNHAYFGENDENVSKRHSSPLFCDLWFDKQNSSTVIAGRVSPYFFGVEEKGWWGFGNFRAVQSESGYSSLWYGNLQDANDEVFPSREIELVKLWMELKAYGSDAEDQEWRTEEFELFDTNLCADRMEGIDIPPYTPPVMPQIETSGLFSSIVKAITSLARLIWKGCLGFIKVLWSAIDTFMTWILPATLWISIKKFFGQLFALMTILFQNVMMIVTSMVDLISNIFPFITITIPRFIILIGQVVTSLVQWWQEIIKLFTGGWSGMRNIWQLLDVEQWIALFITVLFPLWQFWRIAEAEDSMKQLKEDLDMYSGFFNGFIEYFKKFVQFMIQFVSFVRKLLPF